MTDADDLREQASEASRRAAIQALNPGKMIAAIRASGSVPRAKYPNVHVQITGEDAAPFAILGRSVDALRAAGVDEAEQERFAAEAIAGTYEDLLRVCMAWVDVR